MRKSLAGSALLLAVAYLSLSIGPMICSIEVPDRHAAGHHHGGSLSHSSFCAWACHANPAVGLAAAGFPSQSHIAVGALQVKSAVVLPSRSDQLSVSRGPPLSGSLL
ncbi:MAG: hypothetical protein AB7G68_13665 [Nitrospiraceae bacterium]